MVAGPAAGQCVRVVPMRVSPGRLDALLAAHREHHTPAVRRQPGFVSKALLQSEAEPDRIVMVLTWETSEQAVAWTKLPEHDEVSAKMRGLGAQDEAARAAAPRGGYRILDAVVGPQRSAENG